MASIQICKAKDSFCLQIWVGWNKQKLFSPSGMLRGNEENIEYASLDCFSGLQLIPQSPKHAGKSSGNNSELRKHLGPIH